jgi:hypothetical protein
MKKTAGGIVRLPFLFVGPGLSSIHTCFGLVSQFADF